MKRNQIFLIITILGSAILVYFFTYPTYLDRSLEKAELRVITKEVDDLQKSGDFLKDLANQPVLSQKAAQAKDLIPLDEQQEVYIGEIDRLTKQYGLTLSTITFSEASASKSTTAEETADSPVKAETSAAVVPVVKKGLREIKFSIAVIGDFTSVKKFIEALRTLNRYTTIRSAKMTTSEAGLTTAIEGLIYTKPQPKSPSLDGKISADSWKYLDRINKATATTTDASPAGRTDPFGTFASPSPSPSPETSPSASPSPTASPTPTP